MHKVWKDHNATYRGLSVLSTWCDWQIVLLAIDTRPSAATRRASDILEMRLPFNSVNVHTKLFKRLLNVYTDIAASKETHTAFVRITALWYSTSCYSTGSQRPHRWCSLANKVENIDRGQVGMTKYDPKSAPSRGDPGPDLIHGFLGGLVAMTPHLRRHLQRFGWFSAVHARDQQTVRKVARTRLPSIGFRSWSRFLAVSLQVTWVINPAVGCHYFPPGMQLLSQPLRGLLPLSLLGEQRNDGCEQFA